MHKLTKQLSLLLLSGTVILSSSAVLAEPISPFIPVYVQGDDISRANPKPTVVYQEVKDSTVIIPNMPPVKTQDELGECRAFSMAALMQWYACNRDKNNIIDCNSPPADKAISYFGAMIYTHQDPEVKRTFQPNQDKASSMYDILNRVKINGGDFILESCKPFDRLVNSFSTSGTEGLQKRDQFFAYLKKMYDSNKGKTEADILDCSDCINEINSKAGLNANLASLKKALTRDSYDKFLYALFFSGCDMKRFPSPYDAMAYPIDGSTATSADLKTKIIDILGRGKPVLYPSLCMAYDSSEKCKLGHSVVISGYKKVCVKGSNTQCKDVFKVHNSWGEEWQKMNNDGWIDADSITDNVYKHEPGKSGRISSASALWLD